MTDIVEVNGIKVSGVMVTVIIAAVTNPDPTRWYRFERVTDPEGDTIRVSVKVEPE